MILRPTKRLLIAIAIALNAMAGTGVESDNVVGYMTATLRRGDNTVGMPKRVNDELHRVRDIIAGLVDGDAIFVTDQFDEQHWGRVLDDGEEKHVYVEGQDEDVDDWKLPGIAGDQVLKVKRVADVETQVPMNGQFDSEVPIQLPEYHGEAPLNKIKLGKETAKNLQTEVTRTNNVSVPFPVVVSKKFEMILKDGRRLTVQVDPLTRIIVDAESGKPINVGASDIDGFAEIKDDVTPKDERADMKEIRPVAKELVKGSHTYDAKKAIRDGVIAAAWDSDHPWQSLGWGLVVLAIVALLNKFFDGMWAFIGRQICMPFLRLISVVPPTVAELILHPKKTRVVLLGHASEFLRESEKES